MTPPDLPATRPEETPMAVTETQLAAAADVVRRVLAEGLDAKGHRWELVDLLAWLEGSDERTPGTPWPVRAAVESHTATAQSDSPVAQPDLSGSHRPERPTPGTDDLRRQESPAVRLRRAAELVEQRAAVATPGPWHPEHAYGNPDRVQAVYVDCTATDGCDGVDCIDGTHGIGGYDRDADNRWSILAGPQLAAPLAAWLRDAADLAEVEAAGPPLALADQILATDRTYG